MGSVCCYPRRPSPTDPDVMPSSQPIEASSSSESPRLRRVRFGFRISGRA